MHSLKQKDVQRALAMDGRGGGMRVLERERRDFGGFHYG